MAGLRDTLNRFRPAAAPGAPGRRGVPADRAAERESELTSLFAALAETEQKAEEIRQRATVEADRVRKDARLQAEAVVAEARLRAEALRSAAAAHTRASAERERVRARQATLNMTEQQGHRTAERLPGLVARAVSLAVDELSTTRAGSP
ncbi:MAG: hypothetical protein GEV28_00660 [Actinophytocola sp.]|uniref:hypothetical protein n=1 Tax=Actinophytocola sp. TaxID=1872138 RepID=UPI001324D65A|nr:hypothetical protein [Actinophytocola sp.]MPZ78980.1 hypothetical protein [Actinophytocola sp.]